MYLPDNLIQDTSDFESPAPTTALKGLGVSIGDAVQSGPTFYLLTKAITALAPGKFLSAEDYKNSSYFRSDLSFPNGVSENVARLRSQEDDAKNISQQQLANMPSGALSGLSRFTGTLIGAALDPVNIGTGLGAEFTIGKSAPALLAAISDAAPIARGAARVGIGATEGAAISTPMALSQYGTESDLQEDPTTLSLIANIGLGAGLGGLVRGAFGFKSPITVESDRVAKQTAVNQLASGKSVNVDPIVQDGYFQARNSEPEVSLEDMQATRDQLAGNLEQTNKSIAGEQTNLDSAIYKEQASRFLSPKEASPTGSDVVNTITSILNKPAILRDASDLAYLNNLPKTDEFNNLMTALRKPGFLQDFDDRATISAFQDNQEGDLLQSRLKQHNTDLEQLQSTIDSTPKNHTRILKNLSEQAENLKAKIETGSQRLETLNNLDKEPAPIRESRQRLNDLMTQKSDLEKAIYDHDAATQMTRDSVQPVEASQVKALSEHMQDYRSDSTYNEAEQTGLTNEMKGTPDEPQTDFEREEAQVKRLEDQGLLDEEDKNVLSEMKESERKSSIFEKAVKNAANCLKGFSL